VTPTSNLGFSADTICLQAPVGGANPRDDDVRITSLTGSEIPDLSASVAYGPGQPTGWLTASFDQTSTPSRLWLHATTGTVPEGEWWADVKVSAPTGGEARTIRVHFTVKPVATAQVAVQLGGVTTFDVSPGTGTISGGGFGCDESGGTCQQSIPVGTVLTLSAAPDPNNRFLYWDTPNCPFSNAPDCVITVTGNMTVTAYFGLLGYAVNVTVVGAGADGVVNSFEPLTGIACQLVAGAQSGTCSGTQLYGARSTNLYAQAFSGSVFVGWSGDCTGTSCALAPLPGGSYSVTATFAKE
jgi:hypothetical protein